MAESSFPFDAQPLPEDGWSQMSRLFVSSGVVGNPGSTTVQVFADSSGMSVFVRAGTAMIRGHYYSNSAQMSVVIPANAGGSARIDRIVLRLDPTANSIVVAKLAGTVGAAAPALNQTDTGIWELPLAQVRVEPGAVNIAAAKVTDERMFSGLDVSPCIAVTQLTTPRTGQVVFESSTGLVKVWNGSAWAELLLSTGSSTLTTLVPAGAVMPYAGSATPAGWLLADGSVVSRTTYAGLFGVVGTTYGAGDGSTTFALPNLKGRAVVALDSAQVEFDTRGKTGGAKTHTLTTAELASHAHGASSGGQIGDHGHSFSGSTGGQTAGHSHSQFHSDAGGLGGGGTLVRKGGVGDEQTGGSSGDHGHGFSGGTQGASADHSHGVTVTATGSSSAHNNLQPYFVLLYIIKT